MFLGVLVVVLVVAMRSRSKIWVFSLKKIFGWLELPAIHRGVMGNRDSELEQASIRMLIGIGALIYFIKTGFAKEQNQLGLHLDPICVLWGFILMAGAIVACTLWWPGDKPARRVTSIMLDVGTLTYLFIIGGSHAAPMYFLYQWIIIGYGFRFGRIYLFIALILSLIGFSLVIAVCPYWSDQIGMSLGSWLGTLLISVYVSVLVARLYKALCHADEANQAKRQFICLVSHELRTPLNAIIGMVDLMKSTPIDREQQDMLDSMTAASQVMLSQIEDVLDFSKIEAGKMSVENVVFDLCQLVQSIVDIFSYQIDSYRISLGHSISAEIPFLLKGDPHHLRQIIVNLMGNAIKFTEQGRIWLSIALLETLESSVRLRFTIKDTGIGIPESAQTKIFDSFTQADESTVRRFGGTGLGTTICKQLVELMKGKIGFRSKVGKGSEFWFDLEFEVPDESLKKSSAGIFSAIRTLVFSSGSAPIALINALIKLSGVTPLVAQTQESGSELLDQATLAGMPVPLIFIYEAQKSGQSAAQYAKSLKNTIDAFKKFGNHGEMKFILVIEDEATKEKIKDLMDVSGLYSVIILPVQIEFLVNLLHAQWVELNRNKPKIAKFDIKDKSPASAITSVRSVCESGYEILVAEDNPINQKVIQKILERAGHRCALVKDGDEALDAIDKKFYDLMVLDMNMPSLAGTDVARMCRLMQGDSAQIPIIMFSANVTSDARQESIEAGADEFLPKPIQVDIFLQTMENLINARRLKSSPLANPAANSLPISSMVLKTDGPVLDLRSLNELENISQDPKFLDDLIIEFISDNKKLLMSLEYSLVNYQQEKFRDIVHSLKGSALSVGAVSLKAICRQLEKFDQSRLEIHANEIVQQINQSFGLLCEELEIYRKNRFRKSY